MRGRNQVRNVLMELKLARDVSSHRKTFYRYISDERKTRVSMNLLWKKMRDVVTQDLEKAEVLNKVFASVFTGKFSSHRRQTQGLRE